MTMGLTLLELSWASIRDFGGGGGGGSRSLATLAKVAFIGLIFVDHEAVEEATSKVIVMAKVFISFLLPVSPLNSEQWHSTIFCRILR
jgi:hypothetical protein